MGDLAVRTENLGKQYRLGSTLAVGGRTLRDVFGTRRARGTTDAKTKVRSRETFWALRGVDLEVRRGERLGIIGRNGAGKSTLLKLLSQITYPTEGMLQLHGRASSLLEVGTGFHPELTGKENIYLNGAILGMSRRETAAKLDEIVAFSEVERFLDTPVKRYSSGMYVRLAFAVAAHLDPEILIVDEVLAVGDARFQKKCLGAMEQAGRSGTTVLLVSHNISSVRSLCTRAVLLENGALRANGPPDEVIATYLGDDRVAADYVRSGPARSEFSILSARARTADGGSHPVLVIDLDVEGPAGAKVNLDIRMADDSGHPVAFGSLAALGGEDWIRVEGTPTRVGLRVPLVALVDGRYILSLDLTTPGIAYHERLEQCLSFVLDRPQALESRRLTQSWGVGCVELPIEQTKPSSEPA